MFDSNNLVNPQLDGGSFFEKKGDKGILLIHGLTATTNSVRPLGNLLSELGWTTSAPLLPGHGESLEKLARTTWRDWAEHTEYYWQKLNDTCDQVYVVGESVGGLLALWLACLQRIPPKAVVLVAPALQLNLPDWKKQLVWPLSFFMRSLPKANKSRDLAWQGYSEHSLKAILQLFDLQNLVLEMLSQLEQKILIIEGGKDDVIGLGVSKFLQKRAQRSDVRSLIIEEAGHHPMLEPSLQKYVLLEIVNFLQRE
jgi:carboxylesterase